MKFKKEPGSEEMTLEITMPGQPLLKFHVDNIVSQSEGKLRVRFEKIFTYFYGAYRYLKPKNFDTFIIAL